MKPSASSLTPTRVSLGVEEGKETDRWLIRRSFWKLDDVPRPCPHGYELCGCANIWWGFAVVSILQQAHEAKLGRPLLCMRLGSVLWRRIGSLRFVFLYSALGLHEYKRVALFYEGSLDASTSRVATYAGGGGDSKSSDAPVCGWRKASRQAWSAWPGSAVRRSRRP